ncbi:MAG: hypothetical protein JW939_07625 [Candidatus Thermoplasmatota archaeon]|nr:hypothetical protein [Candidatus Thermoplasmatota archaeon]
MEMDYPEKIASRMFRWYEDSPRTTDRLEAKSREVSPCSEYTRYTVEGILRHPGSELSVLMDVHCLGPIFMNSGMKNAKWSDRLGYGMAVAGEDTRVHLHGNGKFIIRRASNREHAEELYKTLVHLVKPALYEPGTGRYLWDLIRSSSLDNGKISKPMEDLLLWPDETGDPGSRMEKVVEGIRCADIDLLSRAREFFSALAGTDLGPDRLDEIDNMKVSAHERIRYYTSGLLSGPDKTLGKLSASIWTLRALDEMRLISGLPGREGPMASVLGDDPWDGHLLDWESGMIRLGSAGRAVSLARVHYLLSPTGTE